MDDDVQIWVIADDPLARAGLASLLAAQPGFVVARQGNANSLSADIAGEDEIEGDLIIWDFGWEPASFDGEDPPILPIPTIALVQDAEQATEIWLRGVRGLLNREFNTEQLFAAISAVVAGLTVLAPGLVTVTTQENSTAEADTIIELTPRESQVLTLLAEGMTNKAIAYQLSISDHTVKFHVNAIMGKLNAQSRTDAVVRATRLGLLSL